MSTQPDVVLSSTCFKERNLRGLCEHIPWQQLGYISLEVSGQSTEKLLSQLKLTETMIAENS